MNAKIKVTLVRSLIGALPNQRATAASLKLKKIGDSAVYINDKTLAGKIKLIAHLVKTDAVIG